MISTRRDEARSFGSFGDAYLAALLHARERGDVSDEDFRRLLDRALRGHGIAPLVVTKAAT